ncbi:DUF4920 domain-containing protein [Maribacter sp. R77961]|uniref:DUF4920 domain-containing protein n=1 Tax=Maribacter sp. R77961 TaxID=3093871 RepID=UPI0037C7C6B7
MKGFNILLVVLVISFSAMGQNATETKNNVKSYGALIAAENAKDANKMLNVYNNMTAADTLQTKFTARVKEVCKAKGCWMKLDMENGEEVMVRFKDYGFFMPTDIEGKEVVVNGLAFVEQMSVDDQRHYAKDGGASDAEIKNIVAPKKTLGFEADGVLLKQ